MNRGRRRSFAGGCAFLVTALLAVATPAGAVPATTRIDPCDLITNEDLLGLPSPATLASTQGVSAKHCRYRLDGGSTVNVFVDEASGFSRVKSRAKQVEKVRGLPSGYAGENRAGDAQVGFKSGRNRVRVTSTALEAADLIVAAKAVHRHLRP
jgi:hypothetical protein